LELIAPINDLSTEMETKAERALLRELEGGCQVPIASLAKVKGDILYLEGLVASMDGQRVIKANQTGDPSRADELGRGLAQILLAKGAADILTEIKRLGE
jgi:hydroxymethylbilane synthase